MKIKISSKFFAGFLLLLGGVFVLFFLSGYELKKECNTEYKWINNRLACSGSQVISKAGYLDFENKLEVEIEKYKNENKVEEVSVFFRDLEAGPTFGINEEEDFTPASLLKVPVMITYFRLAEENPELLSKQLMFGSELDERLTQNIDSDKMIDLKKAYTVDELIFRMIAFSDNRALFLLADYTKALNADKDVVTETYHELGIIDPEEDIQSETMTVKTYSSLFRLLYNVSYLSPEFSEKALEYLSYSDYEDGLAKGVPDGVAVAHKFGERFFENYNQLHDCGIIFYPKNPYLLCVMTRGENFDKLAGLISRVSQMVYEEVDSRKQ